MTQSTEAGREMHECIGCGHLYDTPAPSSCDCCNNPDNEYRPWVARRDPAAPVPQGWKLVPVEPTEDMLSAGGEVSVEGDFCGNQVLWHSEVKTIYAAMLAAALQPPEETK